LGRAGAHFENVIRNRKGTLSNVLSLRSLEASKNEAQETEKTHIGQKVIRQKDEQTVNKGPYHGATRQCWKCKRGNPPLGEGAKETRPHNLGGYASKPVGRGPGRLWSPNQNLRGAAFPGGEGIRSDKRANGRAKEMKSTAKRKKLGSPEIERGGGIPRNKEKKLGCNPNFQRSRTRIPTTVERIGERGKI